MPLDHYVTLGRSGLRVSPFCLGAMTFGEDWGWGSSVEESQQIIDRFIERGGNFIDTANVYTKGHSEKIIGDHLGRHPAQARPRRHRDQVLRQPLPRRSQRRRRGPQVDRRAPASSRCAACRPTTSISTGCTTGTCTRRSTRRCARSTTSCAPARSATSASPTRRRGRSPQAQRDGAASAAGRRSSRCRSSTRCSSARSRRSSSRWRASSASASRRGRRSRAACCRGKYTRANAGQGRGGPRAPSSTPFLNEKTYAIIDELEAIAKAHDTHGRAGRARLGAGAPGRDLDDHRRAPGQPARGQPGGARRDARPPTSSRRLDALTKPTFGFPQSMQPMFPAIHNGGTTVNGVQAPLSPFGLQKNDTPY